MSHSNPPKVSVCIPVYNGSAYIGKAIESVLTQTYKNFELIVSDNCSTDNTKEIVLNFKDSRIKYSRNKHNLGIVGNANRCLELANAEYLNIFHHDDIMLPQNLELKVRLLDEHPNVGFVHSNIERIDLNGSVIASSIWNEDSRRDYIDKGQAVFRRQLASLPAGAIIFIGSVLARRSCYNQVGKFSLEFPHCHDSEMWMRISLFFDIACIGTPLVKYRVHPLSTSTGWGDWKSLPYLQEHFRVGKKIFDKYGSYIPEKKGLKRQMLFAFGKKALKLARIKLVAGDFTSGKTFLKEAAKMSPMIIKDMAFWKNTARLIIGPIGLRLIEKMKSST